MELQKESTAFAGKGVRLVAVTVDPPEKLAATREKVGSAFTFIQDGSGKLLDTLKLRHVGGHPSGKTDIPRPGIVLLDSKGNVAWSSLTDNYRVRPTPADILGALPVL